MIMDGLAFEFVTITKPDEIKDPTKQKAIRRQARRRNNGSQSFPRKPLIIAFDLPAAGNIDAAFEPRIWESDLESPAKHENLELNAESHSIHSLMPTGMDAGPISTTPLYLEINAQVVDIGKTPTIQDKSDEERMKKQPSLTCLKYAKETTEVSVF